MSNSACSLSHRECSFLPHGPALPRNVSHQDVEQDVEVVGQPEAPEAAAPEMVGREDVHDGQDQEHNNPREACKMNKALKGKGARLLRACQGPGSLFHPTVLGGGGESPASSPVPLPSHHWHRYLSLLTDPTHPS